MEEYNVSNAGRHPLPHAVFGRANVIYASLVTCSFSNCSFETCIQGAA